MEPEQIRAALEANIGKVVRLEYSGYRDTVVVISVDDDGVVCHMIANDRNDPLLDFWLGLGEISGVEPATAGLQ
ncbi:MAG TPA: hypothetical protein VG168_02495 [Bryobacteraceae bacterium]|jgi:hypothetical protein|nr:hypothetical protein [Bryobacteraceae bacterium]